MKYLLLYFFAVFITVTAFPQEMTQLRVVGKGEYRPDELIDRSRIDDNGKVCAAVLIESDLDGFYFQANNNIVKLNHLPGRDFLFVSPGERVIEINKSGYLPLKIILREYGIKLESGQTWALKITGDKKSELIPVTFLVQPASAEIFIDGKSKGQVESCPLGTGEHELQIVKPGYETVIQKITVSVESAMYRFTLKEVQDEKVFIASTPKGAKIEIDREIKGETDREVFVPSGLHKLSLIKADYLRIDTTLSVTANRKNRYSYNLIRNIAVLNIVALPADAEILIDNLTAHQGLNEILPGEHTLTVSKTGYGSEENNIKLSAGDNVKQKIELKRIDGTITLTAVPADAQIQINGKAYQVSAVRVEPGENIISASKQGYVTVEEKLDINAGDDIKKTITLTKNIAFIDILANPTDSKIMIDNIAAKTGLNEVTPGSHNISAVSLGYEKVIRQVTLDLGQKITERFELNRIDGTISLRAEPIGAQIKINGKAYQGGSVRVEPGENIISVSNYGYVTVEEKLDIKVGDDIKRTVTLIKDAAYIDISAVPADSKIMIDNTAAKTGLNEVTPGAHTISVVKIGYAKEVKQSTLLLGQKTSEHFVLKRIDGTITLSIIPGDAQIKINGKNYRSGEMRVEPGMYEMTVTKPGYLSLSEKIEIKVGDDIKKNINLTKNSAYINLSVNPKDAEVLLNGRNINAGMIEVKTGEYTVEIIKEGYLSVQDTFSLIVGQEKSKNYTLIKNSGTVNFSITPSNAVIIINDKRYNEQTIELRPGNYKAQISADYYRDKSESFSIERGKTKSITVNLEQITGKLEISLNIPEAQCELYKNGKLIEQWTGSKQFAKLQIGEYEVVIKAKGYKTSKEKVSIAELEKTAKLIELKTGSDGPEMVFVKGGTFEMGNNDYYSEKPIHTVAVGDFSIGKYEVTQKEWEAVMGNNPSNFKGANRPVEQVSWNDIQEYIQKLNSKTGKKYRLPTEAEWEYAARGGNQSKGYKYSGSNSISEVAWYDGNSSSQTHEVGKKQPNELGIYDMSGNVWEWCSDWYDDNYYKNSQSKNPQGPSSGSSRVLRGGSWNDNVGDYCRSSFRYRLNPDNRDFSFGFRLAQE